MIIHNGRSKSSGFTRFELWSKFLNKINKKEKCLQLGVYEAKLEELYRSQTFKFNLCRHYALVHFQTKFFMIFSVSLQKINAQFKMRFYNKQQFSVNKVECFEMLKFFLEILFTPKILKNRVPCHVCVFTY